jgi:hypothetical protein
VPAPSYSLPSGRHMIACRSDRHAGLHKQEGLSRRADTLTDGVEVRGNMQSHRDMVEGSPGSILKLPEFPTWLTMLQKHTWRRAVSYPVILTANKACHRISSRILCALFSPVLADLLLARILSFNSTARSAKHSESRAAQPNAKSVPGAEGLALRIVALTRGQVSRHFPISAEDHRGVAAHKKRHWINPSSITATS